jgi:hypothetical protein
MRLTGRQKVFLSKFMELYRQVQRPLHYSDVAQVVGVAKITAYDMLRALERRGLVRSEYVLRGKGRGPGRSTVVTVPTEKAYEFLPELGGVAWERPEWEGFKANILERLRQQTDYQSLLEELLSRLSDRTTPLFYAAEMVTALILNLLLVEGEESARLLMERLKALGLPDEAGLSALGGLAMGLSYVEQANRRIADGLVAATRGYQHALAHLSAESKEHLSSFVGEVMQVVAA